ncbi:hypothetical protein JL722_13125 [Aureococcus anophagefferens]|nr:hypothetical protein JL722_13125 [Aureococcus anophagefferens]
MAGLPKLRALLLAVAGVGALRSAPSRFANRGSAASARKRILPVLRPEGGAPALMPVPGLKRRLRYALSGAAQVAFVGDLKKYGACVRLLDDGTGVVCDVALAEVADDGSAAAVVAGCEDLDARVAIGRTAKEFPYTAVECGPCADDEAPRGRPAGALRRAGACLDEDAFLDGAAAAADRERRERRFSFAMLALVDAPDGVASNCVRSRSAARALARHAPALQGARGHREPHGRGGGKRPPRPAPSDAPLAFAALRPGRRVSYWWSEDLGWASGTVKATPASESVAIDFDAPEGDVEVRHLPLLSADRASSCRSEARGALSPGRRAGPGGGRADGRDEGACATAATATVGRAAEAMAPILDDYGAASATDEDLARRKARDAVHSKWDSHPEVTKKPSVRDMENELPEGMKFVDNESNATEREEAEYWIGHNQKSALKKEARHRGGEASDRATSAARHWHEAEKLRAEGLGHEDGDEAWDDVWADCGDADLRALRWVLRGNLHCDAAACAIESGHWRAALREASWVLDDSRKAAAGRLNRWTASYRCAQAHRGLGDSDAAMACLGALPTDAAAPGAAGTLARAARVKAALVVDERKLAGIGRALLHGIAEGKSLYGGRARRRERRRLKKERDAREARERAARGEEEEDPGPRSASSRSSTAARARTATAWTARWTRRAASRPRGAS